MILVEFLNDFQVILTDADTILKWLSDFKMIFVDSQVILIDPKAIVIDSHDSYHSQVILFMAVWFMQILMNPHKSCTI